MRKTARTAWANIGRGVLLAFTLELPWPHPLHWLWTAVNWASFVMVFGSAAVLFMWGALNAVRLIGWALTDDPPYECTRDRLLREFREEEEALAGAAGVLARIAFANQQADALRAVLEREATDDRMVVGVNQDGEKVCVRVSSLAENRVSSTLRYLGPPPVYVPARLPGKSNAVVVHRDATWVFPAARADAPPARPGYTPYPCDGCGKRLLVSNVLPGTRYFCSACDY